MTIIRIQIDEKRDKIGLTIGKTTTSTKREATLAKAVSEIAKASINTALEKAKEATDAESK